MKFKFSKEHFQKYFYLIIALIVTFWIISIFEFYLTFSNGVKTPNYFPTIAFKFLNDFWTGLLIGLLLFPIFFLISLISEKFAKAFTSILLIFVILIQVGLVKYSLTTLLNLGADILGYSFDDASMTVSSSESMSFLYFLPFIGISFVLFGLNYVFYKFVNGNQMLAISVISVLLFGSIKLVNSDSADDNYQNKIYYLATDVIRFKFEQNSANSYNLSGRSDYPFLKPFKESKDVLGSFFNIQEEKPNIVIIMVEGLGSEFVAGNDYSGFTPFIDSLIPESLYWENFVSTTGRTFGIVPSLLGSLPFGEKGFLEITQPPSHTSLISILKANGYTTSFYAGHQTSFDRIINFLEFNGIDNVIDENKFGAEYEKTKANSEGYSWGYPDAEIYKKALSTLDGKKLPRLDIVMTLSNHEPFIFPLKDNYIAKVDSILNSNRNFGKPKEDFKLNSDIFASLLYTDNSLADFMHSYSLREEYNNTIFIITGDHRLIPITQKDKLCRFHVPFLIYSPLLKKAEKFKSISSHWDVTPSLLSFLMNNYKFNKLVETAWMSQGIDTAKSFRNIHKIPIMRYKGNINDYIYKDYLYSDGDLYKIDENFGTVKVKEDKLLKIISDSLKEFKRINSYITKSNKIFPDSLNIYIQPRMKFSKEELLTIDKLVKGLNFDQTFSLARELAFNKKYITVRLLCDYILNEIPYHADARTLKGRTFAWEQNYEKAEIELLNVIKRSPYYDDGYLALLDLYWWSNQDEKSINITKQAIENGIINSDISFKLAKAYQRLNNLEESKMIMDSISRIHPENVDYKSFKQSLE